MRERDRRVECLKNEIYTEESALEVVSDNACLWSHPALLLFCFASGSVGIVCLCFGSSCDIVGSFCFHPVSFSPPDISLLCHYCVWKLLLFPQFVAPPPLPSLFVCSRLVFLYCRSNVCFVHVADSLGRSWKSLLASWRSLKGHLKLTASRWSWRRCKCLESSLKRS
mgnify:FL=1